MPTIFTQIVLEYNGNMGGRKSNIGLILKC
jgi:hypothetical protein